MHRKFLQEAKSNPWRPEFSSVLNLQCSMSSASRFSMEISIEVPAEFPNSLKTALEERTGRDARTRRCSRLDLARRTGAHQQTHRGWASRLPDSAISAGARQLVPACFFPHATAHVEHERQLSARCLGFMSLSSYPCYVAVSILSFAAAGHRRRGFCPPFRSCRRSFWIPRNVLGNFVPFRNLFSSSGDCAVECL